MTKIVSWLITHLLRFTSSASLTEGYICGSLRVEMHRLRAEKECGPA